MRKYCRQLADAGGLQDSLSQHVLAMDDAEVVICDTTIKIEDRAVPRRSRRNK